MLWHIQPSLRLCSEAAAIFSEIIDPSELHSIAFSFIKDEHAQFVAHHLSNKVYGYRRINR